MNTHLHRIALQAAACTLALLSSLPATAADEPARLYAGAQLGLAHLNSWPAHVGLGQGVSVDGRLSLGDRPLLGAVLGRERGPVRYELELQQGAHALQAIELGALRADASGRVRWTAITANAYRSVDIGERLRGYGALGLGWGRVRLPQAGFADAGCDCFAAASGSGLVVQARLGLEMPMGDGHRPFVQIGAVSLPKAAGASADGHDVRYPRRTVLTAGLGWRKQF
jgi:opacity protein-like surface antigen